MASYAKFLQNPKKIMTSLWDKTDATIVGATTENTAGIHANANDLSGICAYLPNDSGGLDWVCQIFGQIMPGIVFFVSILVLSLSAFFLFGYIRKSIAARRTIDQLHQRLSKIDNLPSETWFTHPKKIEIVNLLSESATQLPPLGSLVSFINKATVSVNVQPEQLALNKAILDHWQDSSELQVWTGEKIAERIPSWVTSTGLLTTFLAILLGLQGVKVLANMEVVGIAGLVNGLSGKFFSSIVALACAIAITVTDYFLATRVKQSWMQLLMLLDDLLPAISTDRILLDFVRHNGRRPVP